MSLRQQTLKAPNPPDKTKGEGGKGSTKQEMIMVKQEPIIFFEFKEIFNSEDACREHLFHFRWPNGFECPRCKKKRTIQ